MPTSRELWKGIKARPALHLGAPSISALYHFLAGWSAALAFHRVEGESLCVPLEFHDWVAYREHFYEAGSGWCRMLLERHHTEEAALQRFFQLHEEFERRVPREFAYIEPFTRHRDYPFDGRIDGCWEQVAQTGRLSLISYTADPGFFIHFDAPNWHSRDEFHADPARCSIFAGIGDRALTVCDRAEYERVMRAPGRWRTTAADDA